MARILSFGGERRTTRELSALALSNGNAEWATPGRGGVSGSYYFQLRENSSGSNQVLTARWDFSVSATEIYAAFCWRNGVSGGTTQRIQLLDSSGNLILAFSGSPQGSYSVLLGNGSSIGTIPGIGDNVWTLVEIRFKLDASAGVVEIKYDAISQLSYSGNTNPASRANVARFQINCASLSSAIRIDDLAVNDTTGSDDNSWVGNRYQVLLSPNGDGGTIQFDGSDGNQVNNYQQVDDNPANDDTDYNTAASAGLEDIYALASMPSMPAGSVIKWVRPFALARRTDVAAPASLDVGIKSGSTSDYAASQALTTSYAIYEGDYYYTDPDDAADWDETKVNALQVEARSA